MEASCQCVSACPAYLHQKYKENCSYRGRGCTVTERGSGRRTKRGFIRIVVFGLPEYNIGRNVEDDNVCHYSGYAIAKGQ